MTFNVIKFIKFSKQGRIFEKMQFGQVSLRHLNKKINFIYDFLII